MYFFDLDNSSKKELILIPVFSQFSFNINACTFIPFFVLLNKIKISSVEKMRLAALLFLRTNRTPGMVFSS